MRFSPASSRTSICGQVAVAGRAGDERDVRRALEDLFAFLLRDAAEHGELLALALEPLVLVQAVEDLLLGFVADGAGVVEDQPGVGFVRHLDVALMLQRADDLFGVVGVHLAAEGLDVKGLRHTPSISPLAIASRSDATVSKCPGWRRCAAPDWTRWT